MKLYILVALLGTALAARNFDKECRPAKDHGFCKALISMWWFNAESGKCEQFYYGGCGGNGNKYETEEQCMENCGAEKPILRPYPRALSFRGMTKDYRPGSGSFGGSVCQRPRYTGPCKAAFRRFYYDAATSSCRQFVYGGCQSNGNNFASHAACMAACAPSSPVRPVMPSPRMA
ncbi:boophilin-G2 isoform X1 [Rhipicephalus sanguineus]|uniref:boophilin-G2 isoform X1 n=1 Tax=Rhipicephalus sanguineus TaxID=34632 RepID=UPI001895D4CB|nr:boophilin-G2 isoform X1 [Rhipicephalus sanguineus]